MKVYFASDFHLGAPEMNDDLQRERRLVGWLDRIKADADKVFLLGDLFDFWFEYGTVVPKGHVRILGKIAELIDSGIEVHFFIGNHDLWQFGYLEKETGLIVHEKPELIDLNGKRFLLAHGDAIGPGDNGYKFMRRIFTNKINQCLFKWLHPDLGIRLAHWCAYRSRMGKKLHGRKLSPDMNVEELSQYKYVETELQAHPDIDYAVFGHVHCPIERMMNTRTKFVFLGDWISYFSYAVFDGENLVLTTDHDASADSKPPTR
ncbi:MAG: UDP-2,3-diacylglucosamine diphosphatase [Candidatus Limimorpha sp.]